MLEGVRKGFVNSVKQGIIRRVVRESRKLLEQRQVQLKQPEQLLERNAEIARGIPGNHRRQSEESALRSVTDRVSLRPEEQKTENLPREALGKSQTNAKKIAQRRKMKGGTL
jgi:predicted metal-dependent hydrolase